MYEPNPDQSHWVPVPLALSPAERQRLMQFIARRVRNRTDVAELMQEVLRRALSKRADLVKRPVKYLQGIAWNVVCDFLRRQRGTRDSAVSDSDLTKGSAEQAPSAGANALVAQDALTSQMDAERAVRDALDRLLPTHKEVLRLTLGEGLTSAEAAIAMGLSTYMAKKYACQAKAEIRLMTATSGASAGREDQ